MLAAAAVYPLFKPRAGRLNTSIKPSTRCSFSLCAKPSIAVLAFNNMSEDKKQDYFADGVAEDLTTKLSKLTGLFVIARHPSFPYKNTSLGAKEIAGELGVRYILKGGVRPLGERLRVNAQLIDAVTDGHVWANRFDGECGNIFDLVERVLRKVAQAISLHLVPGEGERLGVRYTSSVDAYDLFVRARQRVYVWASEPARNARDELEKAIEFDPDFAEAYGLLAYTNVIVLRWSANAGIRDETRKRIAHSLSIRETPFAYQGRAWFLTFVKSDVRGAETAAAKGLELAPSHADLVHILALTKLYLGKPDQGYAAIQHAMRLNPSFPASYNSALGKIHFAAGRYRECLEELAREASMTLRAPFHISSYLAAAHAYLGDIETAKDYAKPWHQRIWALPFDEPFQDAVLKERLRKGLELAGVK